MDLRGENILADSLFDQLLIDLFTNSVKNNNNEQVEIIVFSGNSENKKFKLSICDNGIGIENKRLENILDRYTEFKKDGKGSGLDLFIIKTLTYRYRGNVITKNMTPNENIKGTYFEFEFPLVE